MIVGNPILNGGPRKIGLPLNTRLLLHFDLNYDDIVGLNTPSCTGTVAYTRGMFRKGVSLNGATSIDIPYNSEDMLFNKDDFTIAGWFNWHGAPDGTNFSYLFSQQYYYSSSYKTAGFGVWVNANGEIVWRVRRTYANAVVSDVNTKVLMPVGEWVHIAMVRHGTALTLYLNGTAIGTATFNTNYAVYQHASSVFRIGAGSGTTTTTKNNASDFFTGAIDEFIVTIGTAIWTEEFTPPKGPYGEFLALGSLTVGDLVSYTNPETGVTTKFLILDKDHHAVDSGYPENCSTLWLWDEYTELATPYYDYLDTSHANSMRVKSESYIKTKTGDKFYNKLVPTVFLTQIKLENPHVGITLRCALPSWREIAISSSTACAYFPSDLTAEEDRERRIRAVEYLLRDTPRNEDEHYAEYYFVDTEGIIYQTATSSPDEELLHIFPIMNISNDVKVSMFPDDNGVYELLL